MNAPTEEEQAMEEIRSARESNQMEDEKSDSELRTPKGLATCAHISNSKRVCNTFSKTGAIFDADAMMINPADKSEKPGTSKVGVHRFGELFGRVFVH